METSRRWYRLRLSNFLVLNSKYRNQPEANCAALQLIPDQQWLQLFLFGRVKSLFFLGESAHIALPHSTKSFNGYANSPLPSWHKQGSVSNNTNICSFKWNLGKLKKSILFFFLSILMQMKMPLQLYVIIPIAPFYLPRCSRGCFLICFGV